MFSAQTVIKNASGLHARPASTFVLKAKEFKSDITVCNPKKGTPPVNAKSIMMILAQGMACGVPIEIAADGDDEREAVKALVSLIDSGCGE